jgi:outer membrane protein OmpA-like peptidoglycan-associated protein
MKKMILVTLILMMGCKHQPPTNGVWQNRQPVNSQETAARLAFCAELGQQVPSVEESTPEEPDSAPSAPVAAPVVPPPVVVAPVKPAGPASLYLMRVYFPKGKTEFKPGQEQLEELQAKLKSAERVEVRVRNDATQLSTTDEKLIWQQALAAKSFLLTQGATPESIWLNIFAVEPTAESKTPEGQSELRRVEIELFGGER